MLQSLHIRDFVIVPELHIDFSTGFTVFSGETGAGKSILIDALMLCLGSRAEAFSIREGADKTDITAVFEIPDRLQPWCESQDITDKQLILRRTFDRQGKSRAWINHIPSTLSQLKQLGEQLVDIHGQHAHQSLLKPQEQRAWLDAAHRELLNDTAKAFKAWQDKLKQVSQAQAEQNLRLQEQERLTWQLDEISKLSLQAKEWETLNQLHNKLANAAGLIEASQETLAILDHEDQGTLRQLDNALYTLEKLIKDDTSLTGVTELLESARANCSEAIFELSHYLQNLELDPQKLAETEARISAIFSCARRFHVAPEDLYQKQASLQAQLDELEQSSNIDLLKTQADKLEKDYLKIAKRLSMARQTVAQTLAEQVTQAMQTLAMQGGRFEVMLEPCNPSSHGLEQVQFLVAGHAGVSPRPLNKVASGGELARISLALSVMASQAERVPTLIFDEVDSGIGGAIAEVVGKLLQQLGQQHQVLCVTHLAQVASCGNHHFKVEKQQSKDQTISQICLLNHEHRIEEIARMIGGTQITHATRLHAEEMLKLNHL